MLIAWDLRHQFLVLHRWLRLACLRREDKVNSVSTWQSFGWKWKGCWCYYMMHPCSISRGCGLIFNSVWMEIKTWHTLLTICALGEGGELSTIRTSEHSSWTDFTHLNRSKWIIKALSAIGTKSDHGLAQTSPYYSFSIFCMSQWDYNLMASFFLKSKILSKSGHCVMFLEDHNS